MFTNITESSDVGSSLTIGGTVGSTGTTGSRGTSGSGTGGETQGSSVSGGEEQRMFEELALVLEESEPASAIFHYQKFLEFSGGRYPELEEDVVQHLSGLSETSRWYTPVTSVIRSEFERGGQ